MRLRCPICGEEIDSAGLRMEWGPGGGFRCPSCKGPVRISQPYRALSAILSALIAAGLLMSMGVGFSVKFLVLTALIWVPLSLSLNAVASRFKQPTLRAVDSAFRGAAYELFAKREPPESGSSEPKGHEQETPEWDKAVGNRGQTGGSK